MTDEAPEPIEPSDSERSEWSDTTALYVEWLEVQHDLATRQLAEAVGAAYEAAAEYVESLDGYDSIDGEHPLVSAIRALTPSDAAAALERVKREAQEALIPALASLAAAISLLERSPKTAAPSDKMFDQMLDDYRKSLEEARSVLQKGTPDAP